MTDKTTIKLLLIANIIIGVTLFFNGNIVCLISMFAAGVSYHKLTTMGDD